MKKYTLKIASVALAIIVLMGCANKLATQKPMPRPIGLDEEELIERRNKWIALSHPAPPGINWKNIEASNLQNNIQFKKRQQQIQAQTLSIQETFANGKLQGTWKERGSNNQAGSIVGVDYDSVANNLYVISTAGSLWKNNGLVANSWTLLNDDYQFDNRLIKVIKKTAGGNRLLVKLNNTIQFSDNEGASFTASNIPFPLVWDGNNILQMEVQKANSNNIYALAYIWETVSWTAKLALYRSTDEGLSFNRIYLFNHSNRSAVKMSIPYNSNSLYILDAAASAGSIKIQQVNGNTVTDVNTVASPETLSSIEFATTNIAGTTHFYLMNTNNRIFYSNNAGASWTFKGTLPQNSWNRLEASNTNGLQVYTGGVEAMRSTDAGATWTVVNGWAEYYSNIVGKLHADMMNFAHFKKADGTPFCIINQHGGVAISYNNLVSTTNLSVSGLRSAQYYDVITAPDNANIIYGGTQDQGLHKNSTALTPGLLDFTQVISGDYGYLTLADQYRTLYAQYPGGSLYIYKHPSSSYVKNWTMSGTQKPNYGWMLPIKNTSNPLSDTILMAGGNLTGGSGSYLCRIAMQNASPNNISATQYNFNFRANSNNGASGITAIEVSQLQPEKMYVATEDGTFFYSNNSGTNWTKSTTFSVGGGWYLYGSTILASEFTDNLVWYGGSGYGGTTMFKSTNGGQTFTAMSNGLPQTLVHEVVANLNETMLFAATDAGPYVYIVAEDKWYSMIGATTPIQQYTSVEYVSSSNTVRFATHGRGIIDFAISEPIIYYFVGNGNWNVASNWVNQLVPPATLTGNHEIFISPIATGECVLNINQAVNTGAKITVARNRKFRVTGNLRIN
jgi:hypothetical protein